MPAGRAGTPAPKTGSVKAEFAGREAKWITNFGNAQGLARKDDRLILAYFRGSDWCPFCKKLDNEVLNTAPFVDWAEKNVVLLDVDFPSDKKQPPTLKKQNDALKERYGVLKTPTFVFLDADGEPITRCGFDTAKLRDDEPKGEPTAFVQYLESVLKNRPKKQQLIQQEGLDHGLKYAREHGLPLLLMLTQPQDATSEEVKQQARDLLANQKFVRFVNTHMAFVQIAWPKDDDNSLESLEFLAWAHRQKVPTLPLQLAVWDPHKQQVTARVTSFDLVHIEPTLQRLRDVLPKIDYTGRWIEDYRLAQAIAAQTGRDILMNFTCTDASEWSQRMDKEIYQQEAFKDYARKNLVLLKLDFPKTTAAQQPEKIAEQNRLLAEAHGVRGYPTVIFLNPKGQKFGEARYMKGGPAAFLAALDQLRKADIDRRTILSDQFKPEDVR
jgi:thioredoxin-related protein